MDGDGPFFGKALDRIGQVRIPKEIALAEVPAVGGVDLPGSLGRGIDRLEDPKDVSLLGVQWRALACVPDRRPHQVDEIHRSVPAECQLQSRAGARHPTRCGTGVEDLGGLLVEVNRHRDQLISPLVTARTGGGNEEVDDRRFHLRTTDDHEAPGTEAGQGALQRKGRQDGGNGGVHRIAPIPKDSGAGLGGQGVAGSDDAPGGEHGLRPGTRGYRPRRSRGGSHPRPGPVAGW